MNRALLLRNWLPAILLPPIAALVLLVTLVLLQGQRDETLPADAILVLGAAQWNGQPSPVLQARLDHALALYRGQQARRLILTGGVAPGDTLSEAAVGRDYLLQRGVPAEALLLEERSRTTAENARFAAALAYQHEITSVIVVTDPPHMLRALKITRDMGFVAYGSPASAAQPEDALLRLRYILSESIKYWLYLLFGV